jgi:hypothetical protein
MTIMATHLAIILGAWRLRIRIDIDEPRDAELDETRAAPAGYATTPSPNAAPPHVASRGRG